MSEVGAFATKHRGIKHAFYVHWLEPDKMGPDILNWVAEKLSTAGDYSTLADRLDRIIYLRDYDYPSIRAAPDLQERYSAFADLRVSEQTLEDWYCLTHRLQHNGFFWEHIRTGAIEHLPDCPELLTDRAMQTVFLLNMDRRRLEYWSMDYDRYDGGPRRQWRPYFRWAIPFGECVKHHRIRWYYDKGQTGIYSKGSCNRSV